MLGWEMQDRIAVLTMAHGPVNALDRDFLLAFAETIRSIEAEDPDALVVTGEGIAFSAGADLVRVLEEGPDYISSSVGALSEAFGSLFEFKRPAVAAINGHAIAGGAIIACACDRKIMARGSGKIGLAELRVGVPFPVYALEIVRFAVDPARFQEIIYLARSYEPEEAVSLGLVDEVVDPGELLERAMAEARRLATIPRNTFEVMKVLMRRPALEAVERYAPAHDAKAQELWSSPEIRAAIAGYLERLRGRA